MSAWGLRLAVFVCALGVAACSKDPSGGAGISLPGMVTQEVAEGGPNPDEAYISFTNTGSCALAYTESVSTANGGNWLKLTRPPAGQANPVDPGQTRLIYFQIDVIGPPRLAPGAYTGNLRIEGTCTSNMQAATGSPATVAVNLVVTPVGATLELDTQRITQDVPTLQNDWLGLSPDGAPSARLRHTAVFTGYEVLIFGGWDGTSVFGKGARYQTLVNDWETFPAGAPGKRYRHSAVWTGSEMIVFGGNTSASQSAPVAVSTGARYHATNGTWTDLPTTGAPSARFDHTAVWTGTEMIVFGGWDGSTYFDDGARYNPTTNMWSALTPSGPSPGVRSHAAVWTGREMIIYGGERSSGKTNATYTFDPVASTWATRVSSARPGSIDFSAVWTGAVMTVFGGLAGTGVLADGEKFNPGTNRWTAISDVDQPTARYSHSAVWTGSQMIVFGGEASLSTATRTGGIYDPPTDTWTATSMMGAPSTRSLHSATWTGQRMVVWGGYDAVLEVKNDGKRFE